jgi:hypothetical protein
MKQLVTFLIILFLSTQVEAQPCPNIGIGVDLEYASCPTCSNGSATINILGGNAPYMYNINYGFVPWVASPTFNNLSMGTYTVEIYDTNSCFSTVTFNIMDSTTSGCLGFIGSVTTTDCTTAAMCDGSAEVSIPYLNGTPFFQWGYASSNVSTDSVATNLCPGFYTLVISDNNGCNFMKAVEINYQSGGIDTVVVIGNATPGLASISSNWINSCAIDLSNLDTAYLVSANYGNSIPNQDSLYTVWYLADTTGASMFIEYVYYYPSSSFSPVNLILAVYCPFKSNPLFYNIVTTFVPSQANIVNSEFQEFSISPNPATNSINISGIQGEARIYNQLGQQLLVSQTNQEINISELPSGMYFVQVNNKTLSFVK